MFTSYYKNYQEVENITLNTVVKYLESLNWKLDYSFPNKNLLLFKKNYSHEVLDLKIPANDKFSDYKERLLNLIEILSEIDNVSELKIISELSNLNDILSMKERKLSIPSGTKDRISFRIISEESKDGSLPLAYTENVLSGIKKLILSAMYSERNTPTPAFNSNFHNLYSELSQYKMAQTDIGSFIFNIDISLDNSDYIQLCFDDNDYATTRSRKILKRIQNGIYDACNVKTSETTVEELSSFGFKTGLNANMCDALLEFKNISDDVVVESIVEWSTAIPKPKGISDRVLLTKDDFIIIEALSKTYKKQEIKQIELNGIIIELHNSYADDITISKRPKRYIVIASLIDNLIKKVKIYLDELDYNSACKAHSEQKNVLVIGDLERKSKQFVINSYSKFEII